MHGNTSHGDFADSLRLVRLALQRPPLWPLPSTYKACHLECSVRCLSSGSTHGPLVSMMVWVISASLVAAGSQSRMWLISRSAPWLPRFTRVAWFTLLALVVPCCCFPRTNHACCRKGHIFCMRSTGPSASADATERQTSRPCSLLSTDATRGHERHVSTLFFLSILQSLNL